MLSVIVCIGDYSTLNKLNLVTATFFKRLMKNLYSPDYKKKRKIIRTMDVELEEFIVIYGISILENCGFWVPIYFRYGRRGFKLCYNSLKITCFS